MINRLWHGLFRFAFHLLYHQFAWTYDLVASLVSTGLWKEWTYQSLLYVYGSKVLELGFGPGHLQVQIANQGIMVYGLDESRQMASQANRRLRKALSQENRNGYAQSAKITRGFAQNLPFSNSAFHTVIATFPTPYIFTSETLAEIRRVLTPDGRLVVILSARLTDSSIRSRAASILLRTTGQNEDWFDPWKDSLKTGGFSPQLQWITAPRSQVLLLTAEVSPY